MLWKECITWATQSRQIHRTLAAAIHATVRHTSQNKKQWKLQFRNRHFRGPQPAPHPTPTKIIVAVLYSSLRATMDFRARTYFLSTVAYWRYVP